MTPLESGEELSDVRIARVPEELVRSVEDHASFGEHEDFRVDQAEPIAFAAEEESAIGRPLVEVGSQISDLVHILRDPHRSDPVKITQAHGESADAPTDHWV